MGSDRSERKRLHRDLFERGGASDTYDDEDALSCRTDLTTVKTSNMRRVTLSPNMAPQNPYEVPEADLIDLFNSLLAYVGRTLHTTFLVYIRDVHFGDSRMTRVRLRHQYQFFDVAEGDIPADAILDRLIDLPIGSHVRAVAVINNIMLPSIVVFRGNEPSDDRSDKSNWTDSSRSQVTHPGDPPTGVADHATALRARRIFVHAPELHTVDIVARIPQDEVVDSVDTFPVVEPVSDGGASEGSQPKMKKSRKKSVS